jgi:predicted ATPase
VLQAAAVIGKDFAEPLLAAVAGLPERELAEALARLRGSEFLHERSLYPIAEYSFKHPLTQAVAQDSLLGERRRALHAAVARAIEANGGDLDEQAALLAHHWKELMITYAISRERLRALVAGKAARAWMLDETHRRYGSDARV